MRTITGVCVLVLFLAGAHATMAAQHTCAEALAVGVPSTTFFNTVGAGTDPLLAGNDCFTDLGEGLFNGVWFSVVGTGNRMSASTCNDANYDSKIAVFCADCDDLNCIIGDDDATGCGLTSEVEWDSQAGANYLIYVTGFLGRVGQGNLTISEVGPNQETPFACIPVGACCMDTECSVLTEEDCAAAGGEYIGNDSDCTTGPSGETCDFVEQPGTPIPESGGGSIVEEIEVLEDFIIGDLDVDFVTDHTFTGDLAVSLEGPDSTVVQLATLLDDICGFESTADIVWDDDGPGFDCAGLRQPATGSGPPAEPLAAFNGKSPIGIWKLTVTDTLNADTGRLLQWSLHFGKAINTCDPMGACCIGGGTAGTAAECIVVTPEDCEAEGGLFLGLGLGCTTRDCYPLLVTYEFSSAKAVPGGVLLEWSTETEIDTVGFRVLRESEDKSLEVIGPMIPAAGHGLSGASYSFLDNSKQAQGAEHYYLEDIDIYGKATRHGPIVVERERPLGKPAQYKDFKDSEDQK